MNLPGFHTYLNVNISSNRCVIPLSLRQILFQHLYNIKIIILSVSNVPFTAGVSI